jgi:hypothetical protein
MRKFGYSALVLVTALGAAQPARAQALPDTALHVGSRIRVQSPVLGAKARTGTFVSLAADTLLFTLDGQTVPTRIAVRQLNALELSVPRKRSVIRTHLGGIIGAAAGGAIGLAAAGSGSGHSVRTVLGLAGAVGGYFLGRLYGDAVGARKGTSDDWEPVLLPPRGTT